MNNIITLSNNPDVPNTGFISAQEYNKFLTDRIYNTDLDIDKDFIKDQFNNWFLTYRGNQLVARACVILRLLSNIPHYVYLDNQESIEIALTYKPNNPNFFRGFIIEDEFQGITFPIHPAFLRSQLGNVDNAVIFTLSGQKPYSTQSKCVVNDYLDKFVNISPLTNLKKNLSGYKVILYHTLNNRQQFSAVAKYTKEYYASCFKTVSLSNNVTTRKSNDYDFVINEPFLYLWPLVFQIIDPDILHLNVGWGIHGLPFIPFLINKDRTVIDFYDVVSFLPDSFFVSAKSNPSHARSAERFLVSNFKHIIHRCSEEITTNLKQKYSTNTNIISVSEYLEEPLYTSSVNNSNTIKLVYGGDIINSTSPDHYYYTGFLKAAKYFSQDNLCLYLYPSPYLFGYEKLNALEELIQTHNLSNVYCCKPLEEDDFVEKISEYDYGLIFYRPRDIGQQGYGYALNHKFIAYLRAGLPVIADNDSTFIASIIRKYNIGVVLKDEDYARLPEILKNHDSTLLKANVLKYRDHFSIKFGGAKIIDIYNRILNTI